MLGVNKEVGLRKAIWYIEVAVGVDSVEAIPARFVEVNELSCSRRRFTVPVRPHSVEQFPVGREGGKEPNDALGMVPNSSIGLDQLAAGVTQRSHSRLKQEE